MTYARTPMVGVSGARSGTAARAFPIPTPPAGPSWHDTAGGGFSAARSGRISEDVDRYENRPMAGTKRAVGYSFNPAIGWSAQRALNTPFVMAAGRRSKGCVQCSSPAVSSACAS
jgi:hypothetical protein